MFQIGLLKSCMWFFPHLLAFPKIVNPFFPTSFFTITNCSTCGVLYVDKILFSSSWKVLSLLYLSSVSQLNVGCFMSGPPILGPAIVCGLSTAAAAMAWIAILVALATVLAMVSLCFAHLPLLSFVSV